MENIEIFNQPMRGGKKLDSRENTSEVIYDSYRRKKQEGVTRSRLIFCISILMAILGISLIGILQYDEYCALINNHEDYIKRSKEFCYLTTVGQIELIRSSISTVLTFFYIILYKRRVSMRNKFKYRNIGLPMITSLWNKKDRFFNCLSYGLIAINVFNKVQQGVQELIGQGIKTWIDFNDPTGILPLLYKLLIVLVTGLQHFPILIGK